MVSATSLQLSNKNIQDFNFTSLQIKSALTSKKIHILNKLFKISTILRRNPNRILIDPKAKQKYDLYTQVQTQKIFSGVLPHTSDYHQNKHITMQNGRDKHQQVEYA